MNASAARIRAIFQAFNNLPDALADPMHRLGYNLARIGSHPTSRTNEPTKENKQ